MIPDFRLLVSSSAAVDQTKTAANSADVSAAIKKHLIRLTLSDKVGMEAD